MFNQQEQNIIKWGLENKKSKQEVIQAITNFRNGVKPGEAKIADKPSFSDNLKSTFKEAIPAIGEIQQGIQNVKNAPTLPEKVIAGGEALFAAPIAELGKVMEPITWLAGQAQELSKPLTDKLGQLLASAIPESTKQSIKNTLSSPEITKVADKINQFADTPEGQQAIKDFNNAIGYLAVGIGGKKVQEGAIKESTTQPKTIEAPKTPSPTIQEGLRTTVEKGKEISNKLIDKGKEVITGVEQTPNMKVWEVIKPKLTPKEQATLRGSKPGSITEKGVLRTTTLNPEPAKIVNGKTKPSRDMQMIETAKPYVETAKNVDESIANMRQGIKDEAVKLREGLKKTPGTWSETDAVGAINKARIPLTIKGDLLKIANGFKKAVRELIKREQKNNEGKLNLKQNIDDLISEEFPSNIYSKDTPLGQYIRNVRNEIKSFIEDYLPEGKTSDGVSFADSMKKQNLLFEAIENAAENAPKIGSNVITRNPAVKAAIEAAGLGAIIKIIP